MKNIKIITVMSLLAGLLYGQSLAAQIQPQVISNNTYTVHRLSNDNAISFDASTPYFEFLIIVDANDSVYPVPSNTTALGAVATQKTFVFSSVPNGTYYVKMPIAPPFYYRVEVRD